MDGYFAHGRAHAALHLLIHPRNRSVAGLLDILNRQIDRRLEAFAVKEPSDVIQAGAFRHAQTIFVYDCFSNGSMDHFLRDPRISAGDKAIYVISDALSATDAMQYLDAGVKGCYHLPSLARLSALFEA